MGNHLMCGCCFAEQNYYSVASINAHFFIYFWVVQLKATKSIVDLGTFACLLNQKQTTQFFSKIFERIELSYF